MASRAEDGRLFLDWRWPEQGVERSGVRFDFPWHGPFDHAGRRASIVGGLARFGDDEAAIFRMLDA